MAVSIAPGALTSGLRGRRILIADDERLMRDLLVTVLQRFGAAECETVPNGVDAMQRYATGRHDLVFLDIEMPGKSGMDCLKEIRDTDSSVFVVIVSGHSTLDNVRAAQALGVNGFLVKPYSAKKLEQVVGNFVNHLVARD